MKSLLRYVSIVSISAVMLSACSMGVDQQAIDTVKEAMTNSQNVESGEYDYNVTISSTDPEQPLDMTMSLSGAYDVSDFANALFSMSFDASLTDPTFGEQSVVAEVRVVDSTAYFTLEEVPAMAALLDPEFETKFVSKWFSMAIPPEVMAELEKLDGLGREDFEGELTEEEKEIRDLVMNAEYIENASKVGSEDGMDKYSIDIDEDSIVALLEEVSIMQGYTPTEEEKANMADTVDALSENLTVWIDPETNTATRFAGTLEIPMDYDDPTLGSLVMEFDLGMSNVGGEVSIEAPEGAEEYDVNALFGLGGIPL